MSVATKPDEITAGVLASFDGCQDERLRDIMRSLVSHLHGFVQDVGLTEDEWRVAVTQLTATGRITSETRQEWILWSDTLGVSMLVDAIGHPAPKPATESTVLGPFYVPGSPPREDGARLDEMPAGDAVLVHGRVLSLDGTPLADAELDVWQNGDNELYAMQDPRRRRTISGAASQPARTARTASWPCAQRRTRSPMTDPSGTCCRPPDATRGGPRTST